jgi:RND family efflux transporter MFP subunit
MEENEMTIAEEPQTSYTTEPQASGVHTPEPKKAGGRSVVGLVVVVILAAIVLGLVIFVGLRERARANSELQKTTVTMSVPIVSIVHPHLTAGAQEVVVPGNVQAFIETPIWARTDGYLKAWYADIGAHVKAGQLLAEIESPETNQQLQAAQEDLSTAEANLKLAQITADRYNNLFKTDSVAKQDVDNAVQNAAAKTTTVSSAQANVRRLEQLVAYEKIFAPFDGVITARNIDVGALVNAGANTPGKELFHLASTSTLRVFVNVPEVYERAAQPGVTADLTLTEFPGRPFQGKVVRNARAIDPASRTLLVEVDVKNPTGELLPGSYASVHLKLPSKIEAFTVPVNTLLFRSEGLRIAVVRDGRAQLLPVTMGRDFGNEVQLLSGIGKDDSVIVNPSDSIVSGEQVHVAQ